MNKTIASKLLQIHALASKEEIKKAFKKLALIHHPDRGGKTEDFQQINEAYQFLMENYIEVDNTNKQHTKHNTYTFQELTASQFKAILNTIILFGAADGHLSNDEVSVIESFIQQEGIGRFKINLKDFIDKTLIRLSTYDADDIVQNLYLNLDILFDLKDDCKKQLKLLIESLIIADGTVHSNEKYLLNLMNSFRLLKSEGSTDGLTELERSEINKAKAEIDNHIGTGIGIMVVGIILSIFLPILFIGALIVGGRYIFNGITARNKLTKKIDEITSNYNKDKNDLEESGFKPEHEDYLVTLMVRFMKNHNIVLIVATLIIISSVLFYNYGSSSQKCDGCLHNGYCYSKPIGAICSSNDNSNSPFNCPKGTKLNDNENKCIEFECGAPKNGVCFNLVSWDCKSGYDKIKGIGETGWYCKCSTEGFTCSVSNDSKLDLIGQQADKLKIIVDNLTSTIDNYPLNQYSQSSVDFYNLQVSNLNTATKNFNEKISEYNKFGSENCICK